MGLGGFLDKLIDKLPIQGRVERWKNELENLQKEKAEIIHEKFSVKTHDRIAVINKRIDYLNQLLKNKAS